MDDYAAITNKLYVPAINLEGLPHILLIVKKNLNAAIIGQSTLIFEDHNNFHLYNALRTAN